MGSAAGILLNTRCDAPFIFHFIIEQLNPVYPERKRMALLNFLQVYLAIIERKLQRFVMNSEERIIIISLFMVVKSN